MKKSINSLRSDSRVWILLFVAFGWALTIGTRRLLPVLFPHVRNAFDMNLSTLGLLYSLVMATYALGQFPGGAVADRFGERFVLALSAFLSGFTMLVLGLAYDVVALVFGMFLFGLASSFFGPTRYTIMSDIYPDFDGTAIGITQALGKIGDVVLPVTAGLLAVHLSWRVGFLFVLPLYLVAAIGLWSVVPRKTSAPGSVLDDISLGTPGYIIRNVTAKDPMQITTVLGLTLFVIQSLTSFFPIYIVDVKGFSPATATLLFGFLFALGIVIQPVSGALGDLFGSRRILLTMFGFVFVGLLFLPHATTLTQLAVVTLLLSSLWGILPAVIPVLTSSLPSDMRGVGFGVLRTFYLLFASTGPVTIGALAERGFFDESFHILAIITLGVFFLSLVYLEGKRH